MRGFIAREIERTADRIRRARPKDGDCNFRDRRIARGSLPWPLQDRRRPAPPRYPAHRCDAWPKLLSRLPLEARRQLSGVGPRRAEIIVAGAAVYAVCWNVARLPDSAILHSGCATDCWRRWRRNTIAAPGRESRSNRNAGIRFAPPSPTITWIWTTPCECAIRAMHLFAALRSVHRFAAAICANGFPPPPCSTKSATT